ncbi:unnamed protein product [Didymodactylos carnosus]|uniref:Uncharacterized protein n=1 Tax=Didymodactylos carnosus TaxID=1234261 RepID=A0A8S2KCJ6_9BILA|nr:unnamed protein product [Didymodactylos carnosus]CAF3844210.1 unnamed protein product [Didymodactylos carnosus]
MPKPKYCQHPTRHATSKLIAKGGKAVSFKLSTFLLSQYDILNTRVRWLCPRCHMLESNEMKIRQPMQINNNRSSTDDESTAEDIPSDENDDEDGTEEVSYDNEEDEDNSYSNVDMETETNDNNEETDDESMEEGSKGKVQDRHNANPHHLLISESNELLDGLKNLFNESDDTEQVRLMTIAPKQWDRKKVEKWFNSKQNQARRSVILRKSEGVLAYPQCLRGNLSLSDETFDVVVQFYCEDGISRVSSNAKDTILINKQPVPVRFMEMTVLDAYRIFNERYPGDIAQSTFYSLRPREVKISSPHEACMCTIHENMDLLIKVCADCDGY